MTIKAKILSLVVVFAMMAAAISALGLMTMHDYDRVIDQYTRASDNAFRGERLNLLLSESVIEIRNIYRAQDKAELETRVAALSHYTSDTDALLTAWKADLKPGEVPEFPKVEKGARYIIKFSQTIVQLARKQGPAAAEKVGYTPKNLAGRAAFQAQIDKMVAGIQANYKKSQQDLNAYKTQRAADFMTVTGAGVLLLLAASLWVAIRSIADPLRTVTQSVVRIAEGAYDTPIPAVSAQDEISRLWGAVAILKDRAIEAKRLTDEKLELHLD